MNIPILRRAVWTGAVLAFAYMVLAFWEWRPMEILIAGGLFLLCVPVDMMLHLQHIARRDRSPFGPVQKWGVQPDWDEIVRANRTAAHRSFDGNVRPTSIARRAPWWRRMLRPLRAWPTWTIASGLIIGVALYGSAAPLT